MTDIGKEYGTALFMVACEENAQESYASALQTIHRVFLENPEYAELLSSPAIPMGERLRAIDDGFGKAVPEHVLSYLKLLCEKGRIGCFSESMEEYNALLSAMKRILHARITSAVALTEAEKQKLIAKLEKETKGTVHAEYCVDEGLLGGVIVELDGKILDGSLRHRLRDVKEVMNT